MSGEFFKSVDAIRGVSIDMLKNLRAVKGENYARLVHAIILTDSIVNIGETFVKAASDETKPAAEMLSGAQEKMAALIMQYFIRSTGFSEQQVEEAFKDAERLLGTASGLINTAVQMAESGQSMGGQ